MFALVRRFVYCSRHGSASDSRACRRPAAEHRSALHFKIELKMDTKERKRIMAGGEQFFSSPILNLGKV